MMNISKRRRMLSGVFKIKTAQLKRKCYSKRYFSGSVQHCCGHIREKRHVFSAIAAISQKITITFFFSSLVFSVVVNNNCGWMEEATTVCRKPHYVLFISTPDHHQAPAVSFPWKKIKTPRVCYSTSLFHFYQSLIFCNECYKILF